MCEGDSNSQENLVPCTFMQTNGNGYRAVRTFFSVVVNHIPIIFKIVFFHNRANCP